MKAFISYSLNQQEQYIVTLLSYKLRQQGFSLIMSNYTYDVVDYTTRNQIFLSQVFVGLITLHSQQRQRVLDEYGIAVQNNVPAILLIEAGIPVSPEFKGNYVRFNRNDPHPAIEEIKRLMNVRKMADNDATVGWLLGGAALIGLIALLADNKK